MNDKRDDISGEDLRAALREVKTYIDVTEEDLKKIYDIALRHAKERLALKISVKQEFKSIPLLMALKIRADAELAIFRA